MFKQIFLINIDLGMRCGKICAQVLHGEVLYMEDISDRMYNVDWTSEIYRKYLAWRDKDTKPIGTMKKVVLKASFTEITFLTEKMSKQNIKYYEVHDLGYTQVDTGAFTCICTEPLEESVADELFGHLKLL